MEYVPLGPTGLTVSRIALGTRAIGGEFGPIDGELARATLRRALDLGITLFETASGDHGAGELLGHVLPRNADATLVVLQAPIGILDQGPERIRDVLEEDLSRLRRDAIDILLLNGLSSDQLTDPELLAPLDSLRVKGLFRIIAASILFEDQGIWAVVHGGFGALEFPYNPLSTMPGQALFQPAAMRGVGLLAREVLGNGLLTGAYPPGTVFPPNDDRRRMPLELVEIRTRLAQRLSFLQGDGGKARTTPQALLRYALDVPQIGAVIVGARTPYQVQEDVRSLDVPPLSAGEHDAIRRTLEDMAYRRF